MTSSRHSAGNVVKGLGAGRSDDGSGLGSCEVWSKREEREIEKGLHVLVEGESIQVVLELFYFYYHNISLARHSH